MQLIEIHIDTHICYFYGKVLSNMTVSASEVSMNKIKICKVRHCICNLGCHVYYCGGSNLSVTGGCCDNLCVPLKELVEVSFLHVLLTIMMKAGSWMHTPRRRTTLGCLRQDRNSASILKASCSVGYGLTFIFLTTA